MGYTHYNIRDNRNKGSAYFYGKLALDAKAIIAEAERMGITIRGYDGEGEPEFTEAFFRFNGNAETGEDYETFAWEALPTQQEWEAKSGHGQPHDIFDFCKTAHKPYDAVVTAVLIRAKVIYGKLVKVRSDGNWSDWQDGRKIYEAVFGEVAPCPMEMVDA
jgi:hypothetical protein